MLFTLNKYSLAGITRLERWERAERYGLTPPDEVKEILMAHPGNNLYTDW